MSLTHATGIVFRDKGVLLRGKSGAGKSDFALRLLSHGAELVGDDYVELTSNSAGQLIMKPAQNIAGKIEVRHVGLLEVPYRAHFQVNLVVDLVGREGLRAIDRMPEHRVTLLEGVEIPCLDLYAFECSAPEKLKAALEIFS